jgi:hypothetical protein
MPGSLNFLTSPYHQFLLFPPLLVARKKIPAPPSRRILHRLVTVTAMAMVAMAIVIAAMGMVMAAT